jgi:hypothetical protein
MSNARLVSSLDNSYVVGCRIKPFLAVKRLSEALIGDIFDAQC